MLQSISGLNLVMATAIASIIVLVSTVKNPIIKAIIYGLPIPITLALIASQNEVNSSHIVGLFLLVFFLWLVNWLRKINVNIFIADLTAAIVYIGLGYSLIRFVQSVNVSFALLSSLYLFLWLGFMLINKNKVENAPGEKKKVNVLIKGLLIFLIATLLLTLKDVLKGIVVTFPFSGVFVVVEMQNQLGTLASEFTKNSIAILAFFIVIHTVMPAVSIYPAIILGWIGYLLVLKVVRIVR